MRLNDMYTTTNEQVLLMKPLPSLDSNYQLLLTNEQKRGSSHIESNSIALVTQDQTKPKYQSTQSKSYDQNDNKEENKKGKEYKDKVCVECKKLGHKV